MVTAIVDFLLRKIFPHKEIGWTEIGEKFTRFTLLRTPWFRVYLHRLDAPVWHEQCHDHPWSFVTCILAGGYWEMAEGQTKWRRPGSLLYRPAEFVHNVITKDVCWSLVITSTKKREWGFLDCKGK